MSHALEWLGISNNPGRNGRLSTSAPPRMWSDTRPSSPRSGASSKASERTAQDTRQTFQNKPTSSLALDCFMQKRCLVESAGSADCLFTPHVFTWRTFPSLSFSLSLSLSLFPVPEVSQRSSVAYVQTRSSRQKDNPASFRHLAKQGAPGSRLEMGREPQGTSLRHSL